MQQRNIAFYPCCALDIEEPLEVLKGTVDEIVFCDPKISLIPHWERTQRHLRTHELPTIAFESDDARRVIERLERVDVLFYRRDSDGEGGSGLYVLSQWFLPDVLNKMPESGGLIVTDGSNSRRSLFRKMKREMGYTKFGWYMRPTKKQPFLDKYGHYQILATPTLETAT